MKKIGFIDFYLDQWHANNYPDMIRRASGGQMAVAYAYGMVASPLSGMTSEQWCAQYGVQHCRSIEDVVAASDYLIVLSPDHCHMHEALCQIPLRSGKPCYIDKTFAPDAATAQRIFALAEAHGTPAWSASALRFAAEYAAIDTPALTAANFWGAGDFETYSIHQLEPLMMLMHAPARRVLATAAQEWYMLTVEFADGRIGTVSGYKQGSPFMANLCIGQHNRVLQVESDFFGGFIDALVQFFRTGEVPVAPQATIAIMAVRAAGIRALQQCGQWVDC